MRRTAGSARVSRLYVLMTMVETTIEAATETLEKYSETPFIFFHRNKMAGNQDMFQAVVAKRNSKMNVKYP